MALDLHDFLHIYKHQSSPSLEKHFKDAQVCPVYEALLNQEIHNAK